MRGWRARVLPLLGACDVRAPLHEYAIEDCVDMEAFSRAEMALRNALGCDAYREEIQAARVAAMGLADQATRLAGRLRLLMENAS